MSLYQKQTGLDRNFGHLSAGEEALMAATEDVKVVRRPSSGRERRRQEMDLAEKSALERKAAEIVHS